MNNGDIMIYSGVKNTERARAGVALLINKEAESRISNWKYISERLIKLDMRTLEGDKLSIIVAYGPIESDKKEEKDHFWEELQDEVDGAEPKIILLGDFNGRVGASSKENYPVGKHG
ncbi:hypothetical protein QE152_g7322 [Popillia japonica]|uniref:Craniofacial development protein 2-like n=1 Tax=Popillia japonica TaxID=7064 RepID=A0AAW1MH98_POPJA